MEFGEPQLPETPQVLDQIIANWQGYLFTLHENDKVRELVRDQQDLSRGFVAMLGVPSVGARRNEFGARSALAAVTSRESR